MTDLAVVLQSKVESKSCNSLTLVRSHDLQALDDTRERTVLETRVFTFGVFTNDGKVNVLVTSWCAFDGLAQDNGSVDIELLTHSDVP